MDENKMEQNPSEKITINLNVVELGYIDLLVSEGYYSNRTDFIKASIRKQLDSYAADIKKSLERKESNDLEISVGIGGLSKKELERMLAKGEKKRLIFVGLFIPSRDIPLELLEQTVESIKVYGVCRCPSEVKERYSL